MSERPSNKPDPLASGTGGWHTPTTSGPWREPEKKTAASGWTKPSKPTLPADLETEPQEQGAWHLPRPEDTVFEQESATRAADSVEEIGETQELAGDQETEVLAAPEDFILQTATKAQQELLPQLDDEEEPFSMSELVALASLVQSTQSPAATPAASAPLITPIAPATPSEPAAAADPSTLSPAERAVMQVGQPAAVPASGDLSAEEYARRQLAQLGAEDDLSGAPAVATPSMSTGSALSAEEYARQQLAQLGVEDESPTGVMAPTQSFSPAQSEMTRKFLDTQEQIRSLRRLYQAGQLSRDDLENQLRQLMLLDDNQVWWMMGVETDTWYRFENNEWIPGTPPALQGDSGVLKPISGASMAYLSEPVVPQPTQASSGYGNDLRVDENLMPLPRQVPRQDPEFTQPAAAGVFLRDTAPDPNMTQPSASPYGASYTSPTVPSQPVAAQPTVPTGAAFGSALTSAGSAGYVEAPYAPAPAVAPAEQESSVFEEARERQRRSTLSLILAAVLAAMGLVFIVGIGITILVIAQYNDIATRYRDQIENLQAYTPQFQTARILDVNGGVIAELNSQEANAGARTTLQSLDNISPYMIFAVVASENERYYEDPGWDIWAIIRAFWQNFTAGNIESGASTITQQIARNLILQNTAPTAQRKLEEIIVAGEIARRYDKNFILLLYMNEIYFGNLSYGVEEASQFYLGHNAATLDMAEAAMLTGLIQSPALYDPVTSPSAAFGRMRHVIRQMITVGCLNFQHGQWATSGQPFCIPDNVARYDANGNINDGPILPLIAQVEARAYTPRDTTVRYPHFVQFVQAQLERDFGSTEIYARGFTVRTTLNPSLQNGAQDALSAQIGSMLATGVNTGAVVVLDPNTGAIRVMVGSPDFNNEDIGGQNNYALSWEQPGSSIKPIVYTAALNGIDRNGDGRLDPTEYLTPATILWDVQTTFAGNYTPVNFDGQFRGPVPMRFALANSYNIPAVKAYEFIGSDVFQQVATAMGLTFLPDAIFGLPSGIGATEVRLYDMVQAYGTLATGGLRVVPYAIESISDSTGAQVPVPGRPQPQPVIRDEVAYLMQDILSDDNARAEEFGTGSVLTIQGLPTSDYVAVKTGTTNDNRDLWTIGFTRNLVVGVWLGRGDNQPTSGASFTGAAPLWNRVMTLALNNQAPPAFTPPSDGSVVSAVICADTGTLPADSCVNRRNELFIQSQPPPNADQGFIQTIAVDTWTGLRANQFCQEHVAQGTFANINDAAAVNWLNNSSQGRAFALRIGLPIPLQPAPSGQCELNTVLPLVQMTQPTDNQIVQGTLQITGVAYAQNFQSYSIILLRPDGTTAQTYGPFTTQASNVNTVLYTLDTRTVANGEYIMRLDVRSTTNGFVDIDRRITINNPLPTAAPTLVPTATLPPSQFITPLPFDTVVPNQGVPFGFPTPTATISPGG